MKDREGNERKCAAPWCKKEEFRIDGYCSIYCRDMHDERKLTEAAEAKLEECRKALDNLLDACHTFTPGGRRRYRVAPRSADIQRADAALEATKDEREKGGG